MTQRSQRAGCPLGEAFEAPLGVGQWALTCPPVEFRHCRRGSWYLFGLQGLKFVVR